MPACHTSVSLRLLAKSFYYRSEELYVLLYFSETLFLKQKHDFSFKKG